MLNRRSKGNAAEQSACQYLNKQGLSTLDKNFYSRSGEIDIIMKDKDTVVFVEVRFRKKGSIVSGLESVNHSKANKIIKTAQIYLQKNKYNQNTPARIDVVSVSENNGETTFEWIKDAIAAY